VGCILLHKLHRCVVILFFKHFVEIRQIVVAAQIADVQDYRDIWGLVLESEENKRGFASYLRL